jgi:hypothetical protein
VERYHDLTRFMADQSSRALVQFIIKAANSFFQLVLVAIFLGCISVACSRPAGDSSTYQGNPDPIPNALSDSKKSKDYLSTGKTIRITSQPLQSVSGKPVQPAPAVLLTNVEELPLAGIPVSVKLVEGKFLPETIAEIFTNSDGVAVFDSLLVGPAKTYRLEFSSEGFSPVLSAEFGIRFGPPRKLTIVTQPTDSKVGQPLLPKPEILVTDLAGNPVPEIQIEVVEESLGSGMFGETRFATSNASGLAAFENLLPQIPLPQATLVFQANVAGISQIKSKPISVNE